MKEIIRLTENDIHRLINESVKRVLKEGVAFEHSDDEWGRDYFQEAKLLANGIVNCLDAIEYDGNINDVESTKYLFDELIKKVTALGHIAPILKKYIKD